MTAVLQVGSQSIAADEMVALLHRYQVLPQVLRGLVIDEAIAPLTCTDDERQQAIAQFRQQQRITSPELLQTWLHRHAMTPDQLEELAVRSILTEKFKVAQWGHTVESYFLRRKSELDQVVYSLIRTQDFGLANELYFRILEGEQTFEAIAKRYSQGSESASGGLVGPVPLSQPHPAIAKLLATSPLGTLCTPRVLGEWVIILRLEKRLPAMLDAAMRRHLIDELFEQWLQEQVQRRMQPVA